MFRIQITDVGKPPYNLVVAHGDGYKREAAFATHHDAEEGCRIVAALRIDSAFIKAMMVRDHEADLFPKT